MFVRCPDVRQEYPRSVLFAIFHRVNTNDYRPLSDTSDKYFRAAFEEAYQILIYGHKTWQMFYWRQRYRFHASLALKANPTTNNVLMALKSWGEPLFLLVSSFSENRSCNLLRNVISTPLPLTIF